jgi:hypothetical protein
MSEDRAREMSAFDRLPAELRALCNELPIDPRAVQRMLDIGMDAGVVTEVLKEEWGKQCAS